MNKTKPLSKNYSGSIATYKWENHFPENHGETKLTYMGPDFFKEPPKHYALSPNWPKENYAPRFVVF